ncbi:hypothetical protein AGABI1DRAFT_89727 [Agaricus bisporus var. burnettii JB137-S8]|uniref:Uncharacterized protein n=1 Tax=Agaricus bisporus var. burnettii (strain JB137-S8 / ATCC MYA-4627 / FGSC 10392) TaxID=597362 RepID=K5XI42_AGABU|nr:uncharacterized protein AGABI1DRAFT_89727 [Agaricus bisporus var. burnettii JB137-S8]EKM83133.1 hypothetical protein AGABI1DRAFT_89727 [Agaricus bisporus var. burnettii JB137-S8]
MAKVTSTKPQYIGIDIESNFFPRASTLPVNIRFETQSVLDLPKEWTNKFTLVHQRLLISGLRRHEWEPQLSKSYIESSNQVDGFNSLAKYWDLLCKFGDDAGLMFRDLAIKLPGFLKQSGFVDIHEDTFGTPLGAWANRDGVDGKDDILGILQGFKTPILRGGGYSVVGSEAEYDGLLQEISKEVDVTPGSTALWTTFWARKPSANEWDRTNHYNVVDKPKDSARQEMTRTPRVPQEKRLLLKYEDPPWATFRVQHAPGTVFGYTLPTSILRPSCGNPEPA